MQGKVALYARVSTVNQDIGPQRQRLVDWAEYQGVDYEVFEDDGVSAVADERPGFDYMMSRIGDFDAVAFTKLDRFGRSVNQLSTWAADLEERGIDIVVTEQSIDTSNKEGELLFNLLSSIAEYERKIIRERMERGYREAQREGRVGRPEEDVDLEWLRDKYEKGANVSYLAEELDVSRNTVYDRLDRMGLRDDD
ncbi:recombinase family protein [Salinigranum halophilum]|uniref:recombinase family protein n=1 Tax=Salinigranum halophilum TaxID=2565931 RepID=UPI0013755110|nr:recombinase family protein [Salinigranum halophilum]